MRRIFGSLGQSSSTSSSFYDAPPAWAPAPEKSHKHGLIADASTSDMQSAEYWCTMNPPVAPRPVPSSAIDVIQEFGCRAWGLELQHPSGGPRDWRFRGTIQNIPRGPDTKASGFRKVIEVETESKCTETCLLSDLPVIAGMYETQGKLGFYYEVKIKKMKGYIAIGTACRPYPHWRFPGWNRLSAGLHLDDARKFFEDPDGGRDYDHRLKAGDIKKGDIIGCGYEYSNGKLFFTYNGVRLNDAFTGIYMPRRNYDVFAAIGLEKENEIEVNFGGDFFRWPEGNEWQWRVEGIVRQLGDDTMGGDELPAYSRK